MRITRRSALIASVACKPTFQLAGPAMASGPFQGTRDSSNFGIYAQELRILDEIANWMAVNREAIYGDRPWRVLGSAAPAAANEADRIKFHQSGAFNEHRRELGAGDVRHAQTGSTAFAVSMGWGGTEAKFPELAPGGPGQAGKVRDVRLPGFQGAVMWSQTSTGLKVELPPEKACDHVVVFRVEGYERRPRGA